MYIVPNFTFQVLSKQHKTVMKTGHTCEYKWECQWGSVFIVFSSKMDHLTPTLLKVHRICFREGSNTERARDVEVLLQTVCPEHERTVSLVDRQQLWLPAHELHKMKPVNVTMWEGFVSWAPTTNLGIIHVWQLLGEGNYFSLTVN